MSKKDYKNYMYIALLTFGLFLLFGIAIGITLVSNNRKRVNWSSKGVVIRFDR